MELSPNQKLSLLIKATEIATQAASSGISSDVISEIIEKTYKKMLQLAQES